MLAARSIARAKFFSGEDALKEVANPNGVWDWALVGPNPQKLPLVAGGAGGLKELRSAIDKQCRSFGLLRMVTRGGTSQFIFIHTCRERCAEAAAVEPNMERVVRSFARISGTVSLSMETSMKLASTENADEIAQAHSATALQPRAHMPRGSVSTVSSEGLDYIQRRPVKVFQKGASVEVFCSELQRWFADGEVLDVVHEGCARDGFKLRAGSMKVIYDRGAHYVWVAPHTAMEFLRPGGCME